MIEKIKFITIFILLIAIGFYEFYKVPSLEKKLGSQETSLEWVFIPGKVDTVTEIDTLWRTPETQEPQVKEKTDSTTLYQTSFQDSLLRGTIYSEVGLQASLNRTWVDYRFKEPIESYNRTDTLILYKTVTNQVEVPASKNLRIQLGIGAGVGPQTFGIGPSMSVLTRKDHAFSYTWDAINGIHWVSYKQTIRLW